jgi:hypothetical protein
MPAPAATDRNTVVPLVAVIMHGPLPSVIVTVYLPDAFDVAVPAPAAQVTTIAALSSALPVAAVPAIVIWLEEDEPPPPPPPPQAAKPATTPAIASHLKVLFRLNVLLLIIVAPC